MPSAASERPCFNILREVINNLHLLAAPIRMQLIYAFCFDHIIGFQIAASEEIASRNMAPSSAGV
jgi:hypothetical protein